MTDARQVARKLRNTPPTTADALHDWVRAFAGIDVARRPVCRGHHAPFDALSHLWLSEPGEVLWLGSRGGGKSFLSGIHAHLRSRFLRGHGTRVLGGSEAQSRQVYNALGAIALDGRGPLGSDRDSIGHLGVKAARYRNGSEIAILAASPLSVRGPHVPDLKLDEVDEIDADLRESAYGMAMHRPGGAKSTILMTSTWHNVGGPMTSLIERAEASRPGDPAGLPLFRFCLFEALERCPSSRSGPWVGGDAGYERCPECPLKAHCHADRDDAGGVLPKAKRSGGHYAIDSAIQKVVGVGSRAFAADYLCSGPRPDGLYFPDFDAALNVAESAVYDPSLPLHLAIDSGVFTGAVFFQPATRHRTGLPPTPEIRVIAESLTEGLGAEDAALGLVSILRTRFRGLAHTVSTDPAGDARNAVGPKVVGLYERAGLRSADGSIKRWPSYPGSVRDGLALVESFVKAGDGSRSLVVHPSCRRTIQAFQNYRRAKRSGQWQDYPEDPQHPHEDLLDALRGGLMVAFPRGRTPEIPFGRAPIQSRV